jgi:hypothetical protein
MGMDNFQICNEVIGSLDILNFVDRFGIIEMLLQSGFTSYESLIVYHMAIMLLLCVMGLAFSWFGHSAGFLGCSAIGAGLVYSRLWWYGIPFCLMAGWFFIRLFGYGPKKTDGSSSLEREKWRRAQIAAVLVGLAVVAMIIHPYCLTVDPFFGMLVMASGIGLLFVSSISYAGLHSASVGNVATTVVAVSVVALVILGVQDNFEGIPGVAGWRLKLAQLQFEWKVIDLALSDKLAHAAGTTMLDPKLAVARVREIIQDTTYKVISAENFVDVVNRFYLIDKEEAERETRIEKDSEYVLDVSPMYVGDVPAVVWTFSKLLILALYCTLSTSLKLYLGCPVPIGKEKDNPEKGVYGGVDLDVMRIVGGSVLTVGALDIILYAALGFFGVMDVGNVLGFLGLSFLAYVVAAAMVRIRYNLLKRSLVTFSIAKSGNFQMSSNDLNAWFDKFIWGEVTNLKFLVMIMGGFILAFGTAGYFGKVSPYWTPSSMMVYQASAACILSIFSFLIGATEEREKRSDMIGVSACCALTLSPVTFLCAMWTCYNEPTRNAPLNKMVPLSDPDQGGGIVGYR